MTDTPLSDDDDNYGRVGYGKFAKISPFVMLLIMIGTVAYIAANRPEKQSLARDLIGEPAPAITLTMADGTTTSLANLQGQVVILNFWASWCEPCVREMPAFESVSRQNMADVQIIGVNLKNEPNPDAATALLTKTGVTYPIVKDSGGTTNLHGAIEDAFGSSGPYPLTIVVAPDGTVSQVFFGELNEKKIEAAIEKARAG
ncbi:MAG TPA: TlpA disulfide reductase family protein [Thermomicrobiales bacterium]|nr:TlpA disulfide reductase family protein [Thermomicrobiales bacterium]